MKNYYVYEHWRPDKDLPFYVGKGKGVRSDSRINRNEHHTRIKKKLKRLGMCVEVKLIFSGLSEDEAFNLEIERIAFWREQGIELCNKTSGGDGIRSPVEETLQKMRNSSAKRFAKPEERKKISDGVKANIEENPEVRMKLSLARKGKPHSEETKKKISAANKGHSVSEKNIQAFRQRSFGNKYGVGNKFRLGSKASEETKAKMRAAQKIRRENEPPTKRSPETCARISAGIKAAKRAKRAKREAIA